MKTAATIISIVKLFFLEELAESEMELALLAVRVIQAKVSHRRVYPDADSRSRAQIFEEAGV